MTYIYGLIIIVSFTTILWLISLYLTNASIIDLFWGFGFVLLNFYYFISGGTPDLKRYILLALVTIWGLRLTIHLFIRNAGKGEDFRYRKFRQDYGEKRYWWISFFQTFLLQAILIWLISAPLYAVHTRQATPGPFDYAGMAVWLIGFVFESGGDYQLARFRSNPQNKGRILDSGFWKYTRHPNYFGDAAVWWGFGLLSIGSGGYINILGSLLMTLLLIKVSGVALLEKSLKDSKPGYAEYISKTSPFLPWFPKKAGNTVKDK